MGYPRNVLEYLHDTAAAHPAHPALVEEKCTMTFAMLQTGSGIIEIFASAESRLEQGAVRHFALATDDVDSAVRAVRAAGYAITVEPKDLVIPAQPPYPVRIAFFIGPVGEEVELFQER